MAHRHQSGVYASAEIIDQPKILDKQLDIEDWLEKSRLGAKLQAFVRFTKKLLGTPLLREILKQ
ncbi:hypothetical protein NG798_22535 [Ancylothrix sp. C2]|uniref:hypothetical protein n=1 Tax=Ancylothrix sp. D3o TaxID=2953691 RepID=UPI0021BA8150|nr:hypothetical protein [Ancylothrix sp. D3o]MCT7952578.1 hypothetical protein [Ancylothrix sp. D3o]